MYPLEAMVDDILSAAASNGSNNVAITPLNAGKSATTTILKNSTALSKRVADTYAHLDHTMTDIDTKGTLKPIGKLRLTEERLHALDSSLAQAGRDSNSASQKDFFSRSAFAPSTTQSISAQTLMNAVIIDPEHISQTAMVRSKQERERRKAKVLASSKVLANMLKPTTASTVATT